MLSYRSQFQTPNNFYFSFQQPHSTSKIPSKHPLMGDLILQLPPDITLILPPVLWNIVVGYLPRPIVWYEHLLNWDCYTKDIYVFDCEAFQRHCCENRNCELECKWDNPFYTHCCICFEFEKMHAGFRNSQSYSCDYGFQETRCVCQSCYKELFRLIPRGLNIYSLDHPNLHRRWRRGSNPRQRIRNRLIKQKVKAFHLKSCSSVVCEMEHLAL